MKILRSVVLGFFVTLALFFTKSLYAFELTMVEHERVKGHQRLLFKKKHDTTQYLIVTKSHGNAGDVSRRASHLKGGEWTFLTRSGNDDKSIEIWWRYYEGTKGNGRLDTKNGKASVSVVTFDGFLPPGIVAERKMLSPERASILNEANGPFFVVVATDNYTKSQMAEYSYGPRDDRTLIYYTAEQDFEDASAGRVRGAIISVQLLESLYKL